MGVLLYFCYGLTFIFLGVAIAVKNMSASKLQLADCLPALSIFGFSHGLHEWIECYFRLGYVSSSQILPLHYLKLLTLVTSYLFLNHFAILLLYNQPKTRWQQIRILTPLFLLLLIGYLFISRDNLDLVTIKRADGFVRMTIGTLGGVAAAIALNRYCRTVAFLSRPVSRNLCSAGVCFAVYAFFTGIMPSLSIIKIIPIPAEVFKAITAVLITFFMVKALNIFNIETRKNLEYNTRQLAQSEKLASIGKLAAGIAHEINNPLTNISLNIELLKKEVAEHDALPERLGRRFTIIERNIDRATRIVIDILNFSHQRTELQTALDINKLLQSTLALLGKRRDDYRIETELLELPPVMAVAVRVEEVFLNIILNAMDASSQQGLIRIFSHCQWQDAVVEISDYGTGILPEHLSRVMEPFYTTKEVGQGTGLGLSLCYSIMESFKGRIEIESTIGRGTTIKLIFPVKPQRDRQ